MCRAANIAIVVAVMGGIAVGGSSAAILAVDTNAMPAWQGTRPFDTTPLGAPYWATDVDYAVYAPGQFNLTFGVEPDAGHYVYAYQIIELVDAFNINSNVNHLSVTLEDGIDVAANVGFLAGTGDVAPSNALITNDAVGWSFSPAIYEPDGSTILYFSSPDPPEMDYATLSGFMATFDTQFLPSPDSVPEPASLTLLAIGALILGRRRRRSS